MARSKGRTEYFEPSNTVGLDTRIWQQRGSANKILGAVFTMEGEIVKVDGCRLLVKWEPQEEQQQEVRRRMSNWVPGETLAAKGPTVVEAQITGASGLSQPPLSGHIESDVTTTTWTRSDNPFSEPNARNKIFTVGTFTWGETVELMVAWGDADTIKIGVLESNNVRLLKTIEIQTKDVRPRVYPRFVDVGQFVIILVGGHAALKWDGRVLTSLGINAPPEPIRARFLRGTKDIFFKTSSIGIDDAASIRLRYYQTFINKYGQESELSAASNVIFMNEYFGLTIGEGEQQKAVGVLIGERRQEQRRAEQQELEPRPLASVGETNASAEGNQYTSGASTDSFIHTTADPGDAVPWADRAAMVFLDLGDSPDQEDIVERAIYRSINGQLPTALPRRLGPRARTHFDVRRPAESSVDPAPPIGENMPPPMASWAFPFRGRTYYGGVSNEPSILYYSTLHRPEAVSVTSFIEVNANDADRLTGWGVAQDYAIVFKRNSAYLVTHDKAEYPVVTPLQATFGSISDRAVASIDNRTYFMSDVGIHVFDGSKFTRISKILDKMVRNLPEFSRDNAVMWADAASERVYLAVSANPGSENNEVWVIQTDTGAFSRISGREVTHGISYKGESIVALYNNGSGFPDLYLWGGGHQIDKASYSGVASGIWTETTTHTITVDPLTGATVVTESSSASGEEPETVSPGTPTWPESFPPQPIPYLHDYAGIRYDIGGPILGDYETEWMEVGDPNTDKRFYKIALYFVQTGNVDLNVEWCLDWDDRKAAGSTTVNLQADDATTWAMADSDGDALLWDAGGGQKWDKRRVVCKMIDLEEAHGKCIRFRFHTGSVEKEPDPDVVASTVHTSAIPLPHLIHTNDSSPGSMMLQEQGAVFGEHTPDPPAGTQMQQIQPATRPLYEPWRLVGWHLFLEDHGVRSRGTDGIREAGS
ncbi:hypothetical protein CMI37_36180 [Candidatus Pacearchaeota archaeon]|nr:hypothetical protein [Candidatus Pacearchaeota archaeon]